jgi:endoglucanase
MQRQFRPMIFRIDIALTILLIVISTGPVASAQYAHTKGEQIVDAQGREIHLRGINLGNWLVPEGYMWQFGGHVQSAREIEGLVTELIGPERSVAFWRTWRDTYVTKDDVRVIHQAGFNSIRVPIHYKFFASDDAEGFPTDRSIGAMEQGSGYLSCAGYACRAGWPDWHEYR